MDHFDVTTGVLDSWDLLNPLFDTFIDRNKESLQVSSLNLLASSTSILLKKTSYAPVFNSISAGYYPVFYPGFYKTCPETNDKPLIHVTVTPTSQKTTNKRQQYAKNTPTNSDHSLCSKKIYIVVPRTKKDRVFAIETAKSSKIFKEIHGSKTLSECMRSMNKTKKKNSDKAKEKGNHLKTIPECSPTCAYMNMTRNVSPDRPGTASPRSPVRSSYKTVAAESEQSMNTTLRTTISPDRQRVDESAIAKSPVTIRQKTKLIMNGTDKNRKEETLPSDKFSYVSGKRSIESVFSDEKRRPQERNEKRVLSPSRGGRIRITGRLGLDEDDKCVLKCDATLNDEPIQTQFQGATCAMLPMCFQARNEEVRSSRKQQDATVQAKERGARFYPNSEIRKESQATQVDFQITYSTAKYRKGQCGGGKVMQQCACVNTDDNVKEVLDAKEDAGIGLKKQHSPLIVISVYSKNASNESSGEIKPKKVKTTAQKRENIAIGRSRSSSPAKSSKKLGGKKSDSRINASTSKRTVHETAKKEIRSKVNQTQSKSVVRSTVTKSKFESRTNKNKSSKSQKTPPQSRRSPSPQINQEEDKAVQLKRALIDDFTKTYTEQINQRNAHLEIPLHTKHNVSNITIDIEGDSDYYNVKLQQEVGKLNTELTVRKPNRGDRAGDMIMGETDTTSLENFLYMPDEQPRKRSFSQTLMFDGTNLTMNSDLGDEKGLNVKDSIEISHKREHKTSLNDNRGVNDITNEVDSKKIAQNKHFQGDDCSISDPDVRDKEIRKLLGIDKGVKKCRIRPSQPSVAFEKDSQAPLRSSVTTSTKSANLVKKDAKDTYKTIILTRPIYLMNCKQNTQLLYLLSLRKPKRIVLTRSQYAKVKRTIYNSIICKHHCNAKWYNQDRRLYNCRLKIDKTDIKGEILHFDKDSQTNNDLIDQVCATSNVNTYTVDEINCRNDQLSSTSGQEIFGHLSNANFNQQVINYKNYFMHNVLRTVYIAREEQVPIKEGYKEEFLKKSPSVKDIQDRNMSARLKVRFCSSDSANYISRGQEKKGSCSIHTIFKCHQKSITPNLGTSAYSLCDHGEPLDSRIKFFDDSVQNLAPKKPFLKRLMSCLVFKSSQSAETKNPRAWVERGSPCCSFDSYHVSTSLGAIEMSSSLYDTTASFYSNHSVPAAKTRRGFLSSVRGLLSRKH